MEFANRRKIQLDISPFTPSVCINLNAKIMFLLVDNYDSFTYNLFHLIKKVTQHHVEVVRNDKISIEEIRAKNYRGVFISPGPCTPLESGISIEIITQLHEKMPIFGVCLGMQTIVHCFGGNVVEATLPMHGKISTVKHHANSPIFFNVPTEFQATRYHSLIAEKASFPESLLVTAQTDDGQIMAVSHKKFNVHGVQFHPESIASEYGEKIVANFINGI